jgi:putative transposase
MPTRPQELLRCHAIDVCASGGTFFFTIALEDRSSDFLVRHIDQFRAAYRKVSDKRPFETVAICVLPDHLHAIWTLPNGDADFPVRWNLIKSAFSRALPAPADRTDSKVKKRDKGIWQRRYWEHVIRDDADLERHVNYIHFNPVKHGLVPRVSDWQHSSFHRFVSNGTLPEDWGGDIREISGRFGE